MDCLVFRPTGIYACQVLEPGALPTFSQKKCFGSRELVATMYRWRRGLKLRQHLTVGWGKALRLGPNNLVCLMRWTSAKAVSKFGHWFWKWLRKYAQPVFLSLLIQNLLSAMQHNQLRLYVYAWTLREFCFPRIRYADARLSFCDLFEKMSCANRAIARR